MSMRSQKGSLDPVLLQVLALRERRKEASLLCF
jgi:hypothetical protein